MPVGSKLIALAASFPVAAAVWFAATAEERAAPRRPPILPADRIVSPDPKVRAAAEEEVLRRGWSGRSALPNPDRMVDGPDRDRVLRVLERLDAKLAAATTEGSRVSRDWIVDPPNPIGIVLRAFSLQTRNHFVLTEEQFDRPVTFDRQNAPYWPSVDAVAAQAGLAIAAETPEDIDAWGARLRFRERTAADDAASPAYSGPFRLTAGPPSLERGDGGNRLRIPLEIRAEPRCRPLIASFAGDAFVLATSNGKTHLAAATGTAPSPRFGLGRDSMIVPIEFAVPAKRLAEPLTLNGRLTVTLDKASEQFSLERPASGRERYVTDRGTAVRLHGVTVAKDGSAVIEIAVERAADDAGTRLVIHDARLFFIDDLDDGGRPVSVSEPSANSAEGEEIVRFRFRDLPPRADCLALDGRIAHEVTEVPVVFEIDGLTVASNAAGPLNAGSASGR